MNKIFNLVITFLFICTVIILISKRDVTSYNALKLLNS